VFEYGFSGIAIVDLGQQAAPGTYSRFQHYRVTEFLDRFERRLFGEGDPAFGLRDAIVLERGGGEQLVTTDLRYLVRVDAGHSGAFEEPECVQRARVVDGTLDQDVDVGCGMKIHDQLAVVDHNWLDTRFTKCLDQQFLFLADQRVQQADLH
jgi:hypothetical protein